MALLTHLYTSSTTSTHPRNRPFCECLAFQTSCANKHSGRCLIERKGLADDWHVAVKSSRKWSSMSSSSKVYRSWSDIAKQWAIKCKTTHLLASFLEAKSNPQKTRPNSKTGSRASTIRICGFCTSFYQSEHDKSFAWTGDFSALAGNQSQTSKPSFNAEPWASLNSCKHKKSLENCPLTSNPVTNLLFWNLTFFDFPKLLFQEAEGVMKRTFFFVCSIAVPFTLTKWSRWSLDINSRLLWSFQALLQKPGAVMKVWILLFAHSGACRARCERKKIFLPYYYLFFSLC